ncbi:NYN domain-containing protein [Camelimonas fluminis]|uniref:NYN domain-containing protein n=1 Tax=Camelimonas fluminis TaxID=1576911 RepID=A0ABV7UBH4_9HYPH
MTPPERVALFIDGPNFHGTARSLNISVDYAKLRDFFSRDATMVRAYFYTALRDNEDDPVRPLVDWMTYNHYRVVSKIAKEYETHFGGRRLKGNMDVEIAVDALEISPHIDHLILFTGDGDFRRLIEAIQDKGRRVTVVSSLRTQPMMLSDALRRQADNFIDLADIKESISRPASYAVQYPHQHSA